MTAEFDLNLLPLYRINGQELPQLPGLLAVTPPKHAARGRSDDHLFIYLTISGNTPVSTAEYNQVLAQMSQQYYKTAVTDETGHFAVKNVDPGAYKVFAWQQVETGAYMDPDFIQPVENLGASVTKAGGSWAGGRRALAETVEIENPS